MKPDVFASVVLLLEAKCSHYVIVPDTKVVKVTCRLCVITVLCQDLKKLLLVFCLHIYTNCSEGRLQSHNNVFFFFFATHTHKIQNRVQ